MKKGEILSSMQRVKIELSQRKTRKIVVDSVGANNYAKICIEMDGVKVPGMKVKDLDIKITALATTVNNLAITVQNGFSFMKTEFKKVNARLDKIEDRLDKIEDRLEAIENTPTMKKELALSK